MKKYIENVILKDNKNCKAECFNNKKNMLNKKLDNEYCQVNDGLILYLTPALSEENASDVTNSLLFAQLVADKQADRNVDDRAWHDNFSFALGKIGWVNLNINSVLLNDEVKISLSKVIYDNFPRELHYYLEKIMAICEKLTYDNPAVQQWQHINNFAFSIAIAHVSEKGSIQIHFVSLTPTLERKFPPLNNWSESVDYNVWYYSLELNESQFNLLRNDISNKISEFKDKWITDF
ncbi:hypothetical protein R5P12_003511 [Klebsiella aerogenes]|nr:hypothetical protein [Klebsiella aerogenes]HEO1675205.1 hypothetical protein [Klebsiella aerogenes]